MHLPEEELNATHLPQADLRMVKAATLSIAPVLKRGDLVILESTVPVGTTELLAEWVAHARPDLRRSGVREVCCV